MMRLDKFLADAGIGTRSEVKKYVQKGKVTVNGKPALKSDLKVDPDQDEILFENRKLGIGPEFVYFLLHKPAGYVTATEDNRQNTVMSLLHEKRKNLFPVGRLDKDTEGLLLITDDGMLGHKLLSPRKHVWKKYYARVDGILCPDACEQVKQGLDIGDEKLTLPAELTILREDLENRNCEVEICIHEGRFHQVKRMIQALGGEVTYLKRLSMGSLVLDPDLPVGEYRPLTEQEILDLKA